MRHLSLTNEQSLSQQQKASHVNEVRSQRHGSKLVFGSYFTVFEVSDLKDSLYVLSYRFTLALVDVYTAKVGWERAARMATLKCLFMLSVLMIMIMEGISFVNN